MNSGGEDAAGTYIRQDCGQTYSSRRPLSNHQGERHSTVNNGPLAAFVDAIEFFHQQRNEETVDANGYIQTPQTYFENERGWAPETVECKRLGWAPAATDALREHLETQGHDGESILSTGLFWRNESEEDNEPSLTPIWRGRYVLPYFDIEGRPVFAISRRAGDGHPDDVAGKYGIDDTPAKYHKIPVSHDHVAVNEPIYGLGTVREGEPVLITEGIADAITAHEAGYPCISPVTTQFRHSDRERLLDELADHDIPRVYIVQDAERPTSDIDENGQLTVQQFGPGLKGAVTTAAYLAEHGHDAWLAEFPRPGLKKVDLDDYLQGWTEDLEAVLASAKPVAQHPAHDPKTVALETATQECEATTTSTGEDNSAVFDIKLADVADVAENYRGPNPLGHHGTSEDYFVVLDDGRLAYDHKYKTAYNALTYLLCEAGERHPSSPNGPVDDRECFVIWHYAKCEGLLPTNDPIPRRALVHVAVANGYCKRDTVVAGWKLPVDAHNTALEHVREEYGVDPGRDTLSAESEPVAAIPFGLLEDRREPERQRFLRKRGIEWPDDDEVSTRINDAVHDALAAEDYCVLQAPTGSDKTGNAVETAWRDVESAITGDRPVVVFCGTREARQQAKERAEAEGLDVKVLRSHTELCAVARGDYDLGTYDPDDADNPAAPAEPLTIDGQPVGE